MGLFKPSLGLAEFQLSRTKRYRRGDYGPYCPGTVLAERFEILGTISSSASQKVVEAFDHLARDENLVKIKIFHRYPRDTWYPATGDPTIVQKKLWRKPIWPHMLIDLFSWKGQRCLVVRSHGPRLFGLFEINPFAPLAARQIQAISRQLFHTVDCE